jgi:hypothetical protein
VATLSLRYVEIIKSPKGVLVKYFLSIFILILTFNAFAECYKDDDTLRGRNTVYCQGDMKDQVVMYDLVAKQSGRFFVGEDWASGCDNQIPEIFWEEVDQEGKILSSTSSPNWSYSQGHYYQIRIPIHKPDCQEFSFGFNLEVQKK